MSIARVKNWNPGDILTAFDLNAEFNNIISNPVALWSPAQQNLSFNGKVVTWDNGSTTTTTSTTAAGMIYSPGGKSGPPTTSPASQLDVGTQTFTDTSTAINGTAAKHVGVALHAPTLSAQNTGVTTTDAATLYVDGPPIAGANETITNPWAAWLIGNARIDGNLQISGTFKATTFDPAVILPAINGGTGNNAYTIGDILYASGATALSKLNAGTAGLLLKSNGPAAAPSWQTVGVSGITSTTHVQTISVSDLAGAGTTTTIVVNLGEYAFAPMFAYQLTGSSSGTGVVTGSCVIGKVGADTGNTAGIVTLTLTAADGAGGVTSGFGTLRWRTLT